MGKSYTYWKSFGYADSSCSLLTMWYKAGQTILPKQTFSNTRSCALMIKKIARLRTDFISNDITAFQLVIEFTAS